jgi:hypothetical protein
VCQFSRSARPEGVGLFLDLDVVIVGDITPSFERPGEFVIFKDGKRPWRVMAERGQFWHVPVIPPGARIIVLHGELNPPNALAGRRNRRWRFVKPVPWVGEHCVE